MSRNIGPTVEILMRRIRQEGGFALDPNFATQIYSRCEQITNTALRRVISTDTISLARRKLLFNFRDLLPNAVDIISIVENNHEVYPVSDIKEFAVYSSTWFRDITGTSIESFMQIGRDILLIYPGQTAARSVSVDYVKLLTYYDNFDADYNTQSELPDEDVDVAIALAELTFLLRFRLFNAFQKRLASCIQLLKARGYRNQWIEQILRQ